LDEDVRRRWLKGPVGSKLVALVGQPDTDGAATARASAATAELAKGDRELLLLMTEGLTNREIAERLGVTEASIATRLAAIMVAVGASNRAEATSLAMRGLGASLPAGAGQGLAPA